MPGSFLRSSFRTQAYRHRARRLFSPSCHMACLRERHRGHWYVGLGEQAGSGGRHRSSSGFGAAKDPRCAARFDTQDCRCDCIEHGSAGFCNDRSVLVGYRAQDRRVIEPMASHGWSSRAHAARHLGHMLSQNVCLGGGRRPPGKSGRRVEKLRGSERKLDGNRPHLIRQVSEKIQYVFHQIQKRSRGPSLAAPALRLRDAARTADRSGLPVV